MKPKMAPVQRHFVFAAKPLPPVPRRKKISENGGNFVGIDFESRFAKWYGHAQRLRKLALSCEYRINEAERLGIGALAESWRRDLDRVEARIEELSA